MYTSFLAPTDVSGRIKIFIRRSRQDKFSFPFLHIGFNLHIVCCRKSGGRQARWKRCCSWHYHCCCNTRNSSPTPPPKARSCCGRKSVIFQNLPYFIYSFLILFKILLSLFRHPFSNAISFSIISTYRINFSTFTGMIDIINCIS